ncbi:hypothetical protein PR048_033056 [Dryococelus australis]|uniref:Uncharacterized protein n=1 Tax=Dryococelus australis TaxID=614101 RepID=A0ABQ9FZ58_9NEOP|nr:hypothetical protein PR048_033056 [Dryococelus australis]
MAEYLKEEYLTHGSKASVSLDCNQPLILSDGFPVQEFKSRHLTFQSSCYRNFKWLHLINSVDDVCCFFYHQYSILCPGNNLTTERDEAFTLKGISRGRPVKLLRQFDGTLKITKS